MAWVTPKTDWKETYSADGTYTGDWFNASDYARIKGNLEHLNVLCGEVYAPGEGFPDIPEVTGASYAYASTIDVLERALDALTTGGRYDPGVQPTKHWGGNAPGPRAEDLNRIESACVALYTALNAAIKIRVKLAFQMGGSKF